MALRRTLAIATAGAVFLASAITVLAIRYGVPDEGEHPYVGLVVFYDSSNQPAWQCTGTLLSPTVLLTAGHCTELNGPARVYFEEDVTAATGYPTTGGVTGVAVTYPGWSGDWVLPDTGDVGVVLLDQALNVGHANLAPVGYLNDLASARGQQSVVFKVVGYGWQAVKPTLLAFRQRLKAWVQLVNLNNSLTDGYNIRISNSKGNGTGGGGTCQGDSGGGLFNENGDIVAVISFVLNDNCTGGSFAYRVDTEAVQQWLSSFLPN